jgi:dienelactone hydrolase
MKLVSLVAGLLAAAFAMPLEAKIVTKTVPYEHNGQKLQGFLAYDDAQSGPRPGVLVVHEWWGLNDYIRERAKQVAQMGYVAFAPDMYGEGKTTRDPKEAAAWSGDVRKSGAIVPRAKAGLDVLRQQSQVDGKRLGAMGFCFGGSTVLGLAYSGEDLKGTVLFHGSLFPPEPGAQIKSPIVILHGEKDSFIKPETITQVKDALEAAKVDYYMVTYANAVHAFTNPDADSFKIPGIGYNEKAARRSWEEMQSFFRTQFGTK